MIKIENQVCTLEQAKKLKELHIKQESIFHWMTHEKLEPQIRNSADYRSAKIDEENWFSAFTVAELGVMLPDKYLNKSPFKHQQNNTWHIMMWQAKDGFEMHAFYSTEAEARAAMLIHLLENNLLKAEEVNQRLQSA